MSELEAILRSYGLPPPPTAVTAADAAVPAVGSVSVSALQQLAGLPDADADLNRAARYANESRSPATQARLDLFAGRYERAMKRCGLEPYPGHPSAVAAYLEGYSTSCSRSTRAHMVRSIRDAHRERGLDDPTAHEIVRAKLESLARRGVQSGKPEILPLFAHEYQTLRASIPRDLCGLRDRVAIGIGFEGFLYSGSVVLIDVEDIRIDQTGASIALRDTGRPSVAIPRRGSGDVVADIEEYLAVSGLRFGPLFRRIDRDGMMARARLSRASLCLFAFRKRMVAAGFDDSAYRFSSLRVGHFITAEIKHVDELQLATRAGVRSTQTIRAFQKRAQTFVARSERSG
jgi:hypothetical protein